MPLDVQVSKYYQISSIETELLTTRSKSVKHFEEFRIKITYSQLIKNMKESVFQKSSPFSAFRQNSLSCKQYERSYPKKILGSF